MQPQVLYTPSDVQKEAHYCDAREIMYGGTQGCGKRLDVSTPIATPDGWSTMGQLKAGDRVFDDAGNVATVLYASPIQLATDSYRVTFSDGSMIVADGEHLWKTMTVEERRLRLKLTDEWRAARRAKRPMRGTGKRPDLVARNAARESTLKVAGDGEVRTTRDILASLVYKGSVNHTVSVAGALKLDEAVLPLDPYVLGAWLGDGTGNTGMVTGDDMEVFDSIRAAGFIVHLPASSKREYRVDGLTAILRSMGILSKRRSERKHIPQEYLRGSQIQRLALLHGLMDTDGHCSASTGQCEFTTTKPALRDGMMELLSTLGIKCQAREGLAKLNGEVIGKKWRLCFFASIPAFRIGRKLARQKMDGYRGHMCKQRYIVSVEKTDPVEMRCIAIDAPSHLYLAGRTMIPTHNTWWLRWDPILTQVYDWNGSPGEHTRYLAALRRGEKFESKGWALHLRRTYNEIEQTIQKVLGFIFKVDPGASYNSKLYTIKLTCGYRIQFGHCKDEEDWRLYDSNEYSWIGLDEAIQFAFTQFNGLRRRLRCEDPILNAKRRICLATNPDAPAEGEWVKERYVDPAPDGRRMLVTKVEMSDGTVEEYKRIFFPAFLSDNPDPEFRKQTEIDLRTQPHHIMEARLFGKWGIVEGGFFANEWVPSVHVVKPFEIPRHWPRGRAMDWGYKKACPIYWFAKNEDGDLILYREVTFNHKVEESKRKDAQLVAIAIKKVEQANDEWDDRRKCSKLTGPADYQICERRGGQGPTIEETMANEGVYWVKSTKNRYAATAELIRRLKDRPTRPGAHPAIMVFDTCEHLKRIMPLIKIDKDDPEVPLKDDNGHWLEALMYICMYTMPNADKKGAMRSEEDDDDELKVARIEKQQKRWGYGS